MHRDIQDARVVHTAQDDIPAAAYTAAVDMVAALAAAFAAAVASQVAEHIVVAASGAPESAGRELAVAATDHMIQNYREERAQVKECY